MNYRRTKIVVGVCGLVAAALLVFVGAGALPRIEGADATADSAATKTSLPDLVSKVTRAIVRVDVWRPYQVKDAATGKENPNFAWSTGTGFVIRCERVGGDATTDDVECDVVTNNHVVTLDVRHDWTAPAKLLCVMYGIDVTSAAIQGRDASADLAMIRLRARAPKGKTPSALSWADPDGIRVGDDVVAIGYARDLRGRPTVTRGIIGATRRTEPSFGDEQALFADLIQSDASINHGNSGGPLINLRGEVVGVNTYSIPPTVDVAGKNNINVDVTEGIFFTRSSRTAKPFIEQIARNGSVARLDLGCSNITLVEPFIRFLGWPEAVFVRNAPATSLGGKAGIQSRDLIIAVGSAASRPAAPVPSQETKITSVGELNDALGLRGGDACIWVRGIRLPAAMLTALDAGQCPPYVSGEPYIAFLR